MELYGLCLDVAIFVLYQEEGRGFPLKYLVLVSNIDTINDLQGVFVVCSLIFLLCYLLGC